MRKIESKMCKAINASTDWQEDNTKVAYADGVSFVFLHGNCIAQVGDDYIRMFDGGHRSATTKSRLNAILREHGNRGDCVYQKKHVWYFNDVEFESGMVVR